MRKFRVIQERTQGDGATDLRGLGDAEVFSRSGHFCRLAISGLGRQDPRLQAVMQHYGLAFEQEESSDHLLLRLAHELHGEHPIQAVTLFFATLDLGATHPGARFFMFIHDGLSHLLSERLEGRRPSEEPATREEDLISRWSRSHGFLAIQSPAHFHLVSAGLMPHELHSGVGDLHTLEHTHVEQIRKHVFESHALGRKAG